MTRPVLALCLLAGCQTERLNLLQDDIVRLSNEIERTRALVELMQEQVDQQQKAHRRKASPDRMPEGFDPSRPLPAPDPTRPDVILLSIDTLRADHLGAWGYDRPTSPFFDELAAGGTRFADAWSPAPWTLPSHATMLSGLYPVHHGAIEDSVRIGPDIPLIPEAFAQAGYGTAGVVATLFVSRRFGFDRGFDWFWDFEIRGAAMNNAATVDAEHVFAHAEHWAQEQPDGKPIFLFLHVYDVHYTYAAPDPFDTRFDRPSRVGDAMYRDYAYYKKHPLSEEQLAHQMAQYDEEIAYVDHAFRAFVEAWRAERPAVVVVTADHGEEFGERGSWGHAHTLFPEQLHVPWIVNGPGVRAQVVTQRVGTEDVAPTLAGLGRVRFPAGDGVDRSGQVRRGGLAGRGVSGRFASTSRFQTLRYRWHEPPWDLIVDLGQARRSLCQLEEDPGCTRLSVQQDLPRSRAMFDAMFRWLGTPWEATVDGVVESQGGVIFAEDGSRQRRRYEVRAGARFAVHPGDARIRFTPADGEPAGPFAAIGGPLPGDEGPLRFHGRRHAVDTSVQLTDSEREMLEALGYLQDH